LHIGLLGKINIGIIKNSKVLVWSLSLRKQYMMTDKRKNLQEILKAFASKILSVMGNGSDFKWFDHLKILEITPYINFLINPLQLPDATFQRC